MPAEELNATTLKDARLKDLVLHRAELEFIQIIIIIVVITVMIVVIICLLNHYKGSTRSFISRQTQSRRQEDSLQPETMELLQAKVNSLDVATLDQVEARLQSVLGKVNEIAKHKATVEDADTQSKVHQLYELVQEWSPLASTLPEVVQRLVTVRQLHEQAMQFGQLLTHLDTTQQMIANSLKDNVTLLTQVQKAMKENLAAVEDNFANINSRVQKLAK